MSSRPRRVEKGEANLPVAEGLDLLCLDCPLPTCNDAAPDCLLRQARALTHPTQGTSHVLPIPSLTRQTPEQIPLFSDFIPLERKRRHAA